jgi:hypothetical protein
VGACCGLGPGGATHRRRQGAGRGEEGPPPPVLLGCGSGRREEMKALGFSRALLLIYCPKKVGWMLTVDLEIDGSGWLQANMGRIRPRRVEALGHLAGPAVGCWTPSPGGREKVAMGRISQLGRFDLL